MSDLFDDSSTPIEAVYTMKEASASSTRQHGQAIYPKKRPSPHGISKPCRKNPTPTYKHAKSPVSARSQLNQQKIRGAQIAQLRREGVFLEEEYQEEIRLYMHDMERYTMSSTQSMDQQPEIKWHMRPCLVDFLVEIHFTFRLRPETLYLCLNIIDRYVSRRIVYIKHYQLVGCAALWIAAKFEDAKERVPTVADLAQICRDTYDESAFIQMEGHVLATIQFCLGHPTAESWLRIACCGPSQEEQKVQNVARFLMEITLFYRDFIKYVPSAIAQGALTLARFLCGKTPINDESEECLEIVACLDVRLATHVNELSETLVKKYSYAFYSKAATFVVQYYLEGGRYVQPTPSPLMPVTPTRTSMSAFSTPMSTSTSASDASDDMPLTPTSPAFANDPFGGQTHNLDKENLPTVFEPVLNKQRVNSPPEQFLPHDYVQLSTRPALHNLNISSPRVAAVS